MTTESLSLEGLPSVPAKILVVEDDKDISGMLETVLRENGFDVYAAQDGKLGASMLAKVSPDLVLLDLQIPNRTGLELLGDVRKRDQEFGIFMPVVILTGVYTSRNDKVISLNSGADDFLHKPFDLVELLARVRSLLRIRELNKRAQYLATHDHLTRCYNRRFLVDFVRREFERAKRYKKPFSYLLLDMDHFKDINDEFGHDQGDNVLMQVGFKLQDFFRAVDCVARLGGDEFAAVLPDCGAEDAAKVGERLVKEMKVPSGSPELSTKIRERVSFSLGIASLPDHAPDIETLMKKADEAMYAAKSAGRDQFRMAAA